MGKSFMEDTAITEKVDKLAEVLACAEASGPEGLGCLHRWFLEIQRWAAEQDRPDIATLATAVAAVLEDLIIDKLFSQSLVLDCGDNGSDLFSCGCRTTGAGGHGRDEIRSRLAAELHRRRDNDKAVTALEDETHPMTEQYAASVA
jgi:hypothetical protein